MSTIRFSDAITALLAAYAAATPLAGVLIADGPEPTAVYAPDFIVVGHDGSLDPEGALADVTEAGTSSQQWMAMGGSPQREESGSVHCVAVAQTGDQNDLPARRARAQALVAACEDAAINAGDVGGIVFDGTLDAHFISRQNPQGCAVMAAFTVGYECPY